MACFDNPKYKEMVLKEGTYYPESDIDFPIDNPNKKLLPVPKIRDMVFDENYPYLDESWHFKWEHFKCYFTAHTYVRFMQRLKWGIRYKGQENLKKYKKELAGGAISIANHAYRWDYVAVFQGLNLKQMWAPVFGDHLMTKDHWYIRYIGGIPVPSSMAAMKKFNEAFDILHERKEWIHVFPEASRWNFYKPLRPFYKGAFSMAYKYNIPIVPVNLSYRPRTGIYKLFGKANEPLITVNVGEPIFPDTSVHRKIEVERLREEGFKAMLKLAGIEKNPWSIVPLDEK